MARNKKEERAKILTGWKEIGGYLGKGVRTVQRYERVLGLPVRRPAGKSRAAVVATKAELDAWVKASPYRDVFSLFRPTMDHQVFLTEMAQRVDEMRRLRDQMSDLRDEVRKTVTVLRQSIDSVHTVMENSWGGRKVLSVGDFNSNGIFDLVGTRPTEKAS
jgi:hypothetical protein